MNLKQKIDADLKNAMLARSDATVTLLRSLKSAILDLEIKTGTRDEGAKDAEIERILMGEVKKRKESSLLYAENGRVDLAENENEEIELIEKYLPKQLSEDELVRQVDEILAEMQGMERQNMGLVIGKVKAKVGATADGFLIAKIVREKI